MTEKILSRLQETLSVVHNSKACIDKILNEKNDFETTLNLLNNTMKLEIGGCNLDRFEDTIKNYLTISINSKELNPPNFYLEDYNKMQKQISDLQQELELSKKVHAKTQSELEKIVEKESNPGPRYELILKSRGTGIWNSAIAITNKYVVNAREDNTVRVWNLEKQSEFILGGHMSSITSVAISKNNKYVVSGSWDRTVRLWDLKTKNEKVIMQGHKNSITSVAIAEVPSTIISDTKTIYIVSASDDKTLIVWNLDTKTLEGTLCGHTGWVTSVAITNDNRYAVSGSIDKSVRVWNLRNMSQECILLGHIDSISSIDITSDDSYIVTGSRDNDLIIWNLKKRTQEAVLKGHSNNVAGVSITSDNKFIVSGSWDKTIRVWNLQKKNQVCIVGNHYCEITYVKVILDNKFIVSRSADGTPKVWSFDNTKFS
jgi:WD40 repeat protein